MSDGTLLVPCELTDAELDAVSGGAQGGLVNVDIQNVLNNNQVDIDIIRDVNVDIDRTIVQVGVLARQRAQQ